MMDEIPYEGKLTIGHNVQIGYFAQNQAQMLDENLSVFDTIDYVAKGDIRLKIRDILGAFMFGGEASDKKVKLRIRHPYKSITLRHICTCGRCFNEIYIVISINRCWGTGM